MDVRKRTKKGKTGRRLCLTNKDQCPSYFQAKFNTALWPEQWSLCGTLVLGGFMTRCPGGEPDLGGAKAKQRVLIHSDTPPRLGRAQGVERRMTWSVQFHDKERGDWGTREKERVETILNLKRRGRRAVHLRIQGLKVCEILFSNTQIKACHIHLKILRNQWREGNKQYWPKRSFPQPIMIISLPNNYLSLLCVCDATNTK